MVPYLLSYNLGRTLIIVGRFKWRGKYTRGCFWTNLREAETDGRNIVTSSKVLSCQLLTFWNSISPIQFSNQISQFRHFAVGWEQRARLFPFFFSLSIFDTTSIPFFYKVKKKATTIPSKHSPISSGNPFSLRKWAKDSTLRPANEFTADMALTIKKKVVAIQNVVWNRTK